jgi:hypothetical protein
MRAWGAHDLRWSVALVLVVALAASASGLGNLFAYDDIPIIVENPMVTQLHGLGEYLVDSYWGPSRGNSLYRPLTVIAYALEWAVGGGSAFPFHLANVVLYAATAVAVLALFRQLPAPRAGGHRRGGLRRASGARRSGGERRRPVGDVDGDPDAARRARLRA